MRLVRTPLAGLLILLMSGCGPHYVVASRETGRPLIIVSSAYTQSGCLDNLHEEAERLGVGLRSLSVKGSFFGDTLLWPFYKGYTCTGTVTMIDRRGSGAERPPSP